jgi:hypothetical protein
MRITSAYVGDRVPATQGAQLFVRAHCVGARGHSAFVCLSCRALVPNVYNLVEHIGLLPDQWHCVALRCADCFDYHPLTATAIAQLCDQANLWPLVSDTLAPDVGHCSQANPSPAKA